jgi:hypothetical protein
MDPTGQAGMGSISAGLCKSCTVLSASFYPTYDDNTPATVPNGLYIHHFISYDTTKSLKRIIPGCEGGLPASYAPFIDRGEDSGETETIFTTSDGKLNSGFQFGTSPKILMQNDLVNLKVARSVIRVRCRRLPGQGAGSEEYAFSNCSPLSTVMSIDVTLFNFTVFFTNPGGMTH